MKAVDNLRGRRAVVVIDGAPRRVTVVTHIRDRFWLVKGPTLPSRFQRPDGSRRTTVVRAAMTLLK